MKRGISIDMIRTSIVPVTHMNYGQFGHWRPPRLSATCSSQCSLDWSQSSLMGSQLIRFMIAEAKHLDSEREREKR